MKELNILSILLLLLQPSLQKNNGLLICKSRQCRRWIESDMAVKQLYKNIDIYELLSFAAYNIFDVNTEICDTHKYW